MADDHARTYDIGGDPFQNHSDDLQENVAILANEPKIPDIIERDARQLLLDAKKELELLNKIIKRGSEEYIRCTQLIDRLDVVMAPHKYLPPEILSKIFRFTLPHDFSITIPPAKKSSSADRKVPEPWSLGHICAGWRRIALGESRLWNRVELFKPLQVHRPIIEAVFARSGTVPLEATVVTSPSSLDVVAIFVLPHAARFSWLRLEVSSQEAGRLLSIPGLFPSVEQILVMDANSGLVDRPREVKIPGNKIRAFEGSSKLFNLGLRIAPDHDPLPANVDILLPFTQIRDLDVIAVLPRVALEMLKKMPNLESCAISIGGDKEFYGLAPSGFIHPRLERFSLHAADPMVGRVFLLHLTLPALRHLSHSFTGVIDPYNTTEASSPLVKFLQRSSCQLRFIRSNYTETSLRAIIEQSHSTLAHIDFINATLPSRTITKIGREGWAPDLRTAACSITFQDCERVVKTLEALWSREAASRADSEQQRAKSLNGN